MPDLKRIEREIRQCLQDKEANVTVTPVQDNLTHLKGTIVGPKETVYEGGTFVIDIQLPDDYPFRAPKMKFDTLIYHPNISSQTGAICLDILKDAWSPVLTLKTALISLQSLLCDPVPDDPQDAQVAKHYLSDREGFNETARAWTRQHASENAKISRLQDMGFEKDVILKALQQTKGNEEQAIELILTGFQ